MGRREQLVVAIAMKVRAKLGATERQREDRTGEYLPREYNTFSAH